MSEIVRLLGPEDAQCVHEAVAGVFDYETQPSWIAEFLGDPRHHLVAALDEGSGRVVGFISSVHYVHPDKAPELWINEVSVAPSHQRRGLALRMREEVKELGRKLGCTTAWVLTHRSNAPAMQLYAKAGGVSAPELAVMVEFSLQGDDSAAADGTVVR